VGCTLLLVDYPAYPRGDGMVPDLGHFGKYRPVFPIIGLSTRG